MDQVCVSVPCLVLNSSSITASVSDTLFGDWLPTRSIQPTVYCLTRGISGSNETDRAVVAIVIGDHDLDGIKLLAPHGLCLSAASTFLSFPTTLAVDMAWIENAVYPVATTHAMAVQSFTPDTTSPALLYFDMDWDKRLITMQFTEAIDVSTISITDIIIQVRQVVLVVMMSRFFA